MTLWVKGVFQEVIPPERIAFTFGFVDSDGRPARPPLVPDWPLDTMIETTVLLRETTRGTSMTIRQRVNPPEAASIEAVMRERRLAREGWTQVLDRLAEHLAVTMSRKDRAK